MSLPLSSADGPCYCPHFTEGETEALTLLKVTQFIHQGLKASLTINLGQMGTHQLQGYSGSVLGFSLESPSQGQEGKGAPSGRVPQAAQLLGRGRALQDLAVRFANSRSSAHPT